MHRGGEPFEYSRRAAEVLRHRFISDLVRALAPRPARLLDVGCSEGQLTVHLTAVPEIVVAVDLSRAAVRAARERLRSGGAGARFVVADATALPFGAGRFDVVVMSDGLHSWQLPAAERRAALAQAGYVVRAGGHAVLTEYLQPRAFAEFVSEVRAGPFQVVAVEYLHDRLWYRIESWFKAVRDWRWVGRLFGSVPVARLLGRVARLFGRRGSRHICVVARRAATD